MSNSVHNSHNERTIHTHCTDGCVLCGAPAAHHATAYLGLPDVVDAYIRVTEEQLDDVVVPVVASLVQGCPAVVVEAVDAGARLEQRAHRLCVALDDSLGRVRSRAYGNVVSRHGCVRVYIY